MKVILFRLGIGSVFFISMSKTLSGSCKPFIHIEYLNTSTVIYVTTFGDRVSFRKISEGLCVCGLVCVYK